VGGIGCAVSIQATAPPTAAENPQYMRRITPATTRPPLADSTNTQRIQ
jgi:hypothetical protein